MEHKSVEIRYIYFRFDDGIRKLKFWMIKYSRLSGEIIQVANQSFVVLIELSIFWSIFIIILRYYVCKFLLALLILKQDHF